ncbi:hypothetical protein C9374_001382 [Naegleria lovaniensis]|uniref:Dynamin N-terminal domain-containing protein n=1 Tax=Naegleria lovaniensis TaxID=51637 RepID=A0AA88KMP2_NAELO|nr:uncharacterized protein C9374_001382 [Naegleria lovaniensis]KAG2387788.1 hypothetical protein C9374_001382 [Naegleria lovaniensis]
MEYLGNIYGKTISYYNNGLYGASSSPTNVSSTVPQILSKDVLDLYSKEMADIAKESYQLDFSRTPLNKNVVLCLGSQSSGKSSLINYLFSSLSIRETGENAIDTQFTIIECVSEKEFVSLVGSTRYNKLMNELNRKTKHDPNFDLYEWKTNPMERQHTDDREDLIYHELSHTDKMNRYKQFYESNMKSVLIKHHELVKAFIVNAHFVDGTELEQLESDIRKKSKSREKSSVEAKQQKKKEQEIHDFIDNLYFEAKKNTQKDEPEDWQVVDPKMFSTNQNDEDNWLVENLIFIDTPGFNGSMNCDIEKFRANIEVLEFFYKQSSLVLFLLSPNHLLSIGNSLYMLQLTIIDHETREKLYKIVYNQLQLTSSTPQDEQPNVQQSSSSGGGIVSAVGKTILDTLLMGCYSALESNFKTALSNIYGGSSKSKGTQDFYFGSSIYEKLFFVINKIGCSIGRNFRFLPLPTASRVISIACPNEIRKQVAFASYIRRRDVNLSGTSLGELSQLEKIIRALKDDKQVQLNYINHIQYIFEKIEQKHQSLGYYSQYMLGTAFERAKSICNLCYQPVQNGV